MGGPKGGLGVRLSTSGFDSNWPRLLLLSKHDAGGHEIVGFEKGKIADTLSGDSRAGNQLKEF